MAMAVLADASVGVPSILGGAKGVAVLDAAAASMGGRQVRLWTAVFL